MTNSSKEDLSPSISVKEIKLPKGGGAISNIGQSFQPDLFSGTGTYSIPFPITAARGLEPVVSLDYSTSSGNSEFGLGISMPVSSFSRETDKGIPRYDGNDLFTSSDFGRLVIALSNDNTRDSTVMKIGETNYTVTRYLPRLESVFSKIEFWVNDDSGESHWEVFSADNVKSTYGTTDNSRIFNPENKHQIFQWLIDNSTDSKGDEIVYTYKAENDENVPPFIKSADRPFSANRYLHKIQYGKIQSEIGFAFEVIFDYGEYDTSNPANAYKPVREWLCRQDAFSSFKSGFEIRTNRLCRQILLFHCFEKELGNPFLVKQATLVHQQNQQYGSVSLDSLSMLLSVTLTGHRKNEDGTIESAGWPAVLLSYTQFSVKEDPSFQQLKMGNGTIPGYINESEYLPVDLHAEGLPGLLYAGADSTFYLSPLGNGEFSKPESFSSFPVNRDVQDGGASITDLDANGELELVVQKGSINGFYQWAGKGWNSFLPFERYPVDLSNPFLESTDLTGDGREDLLQVGKNEAQFYSSNGKKGYSSCSIVPNSTGVPALMDSYPGELIGFADVFGDGLSHRIRLTAGSLEVWPCLGYGKFGKKISISQSPKVTGDFDKSRIYFADIDGSGTADIIYAYSDRIEIFFNLSGNSFSDPFVLKLPESMGLLDKISFLDIYGTGTVSLLYSKMKQVPVHYCYNFVSSEGVEVSPKPYLLTEVNSNTGMITRIEYSSSVKFALEDKKAGRPWITKMRFPVQVVAKLTIEDLVSQNRSVVRFRYHDGYYNPIEKEFAGFGFVETWDSDEETQDLSSAPTVYTKSWQFTGGYELYNKIIDQYKKEYYKGDRHELDFPGCEFENVDWNNQEEARQAYYALKGWVMRTEVYGQDNSPDSINPYTVVQSNRTVVMVQPPANKKPAVFRVDSNQAINYQYERNPEDPRIQQEFTVEVDPQSGKIVKSCSVYLPRRSDILRVVRSTASRNRFAHSSGSDAFFRNGVPIETWQFEVSGWVLPESGYFSRKDIEPVAKAMDQPLLYGTVTIPPGIQAQTLVWNQYFFWNELQTSYAPLGEITARCLLHHSEEAAFSIISVENGALPHLSDEMAEKMGGYMVPVKVPQTEKEKYYWNRGLVQYYHLKDNPWAFFLPAYASNDFAESSSPLCCRADIEYDGYYLGIIKTSQLIDKQQDGKNLENWVKARIDYNNMQPCETTDKNDKKSQVLFDALGQVVVSSVFGNEEGKPAGGMALYPINKVYQYPKDITKEGLLLDPLNYVKGACTFFFYDLFSFSKTGTPVYYLQLERQSFYSQDPTGQDALTRTVIQYEDGFGRNIETKATVQTTGDGKMQWLVSGKTIYNSKGKPYKQYLPYFSDNGNYEVQKEEGNPTVLHYDALLRLIRTDTPKGFFTRTEISAWEVVEFDEDDTVLDSVFYTEFMNKYPVDPTPEQKEEWEALQKAAVFYNTPEKQVLDNLGNAAFSIACNLGNVLSSQFETINGVTKVLSMEIYNQLINQGYLLESKEKPVGTWITPKFQPYEPGFKITLTGEVEKYSLEVCTLLRQHCLTTQINCDITGRVVRSVDPKLYFINQQEKQSYFSVQNTYFMGSSNPAIVDSPDSGSQVHVNNIFDKLFWSWSARNFCQMIGYDRLQRNSALFVKKIEDDSNPTSTDGFNLVEVITYGESQPDASLYNLNGAIYETKDLAGKLQYKSYSLTGNIISSTRWVASKYTEAIDWKQPVSLGDPYLSLFSYNAMGLLQKTIYPDGSESRCSYNHGGLLKAVSVKPSGKTDQPMIKDILYYPNIEKETVSYGNGVTVQNNYELLTQRLKTILTKRKGSNRASGSESNIVQQIRYTYDPVGNVTNVFDDSAEHVFNANQSVLPESKYEYDALYRLIYAKGRQHPGILADTDPGGPFKQAFFTQLPCVNDSCKLQLFEENYNYDDAGNLLAKNHSSLSANWTFETPVDKASNRLTGIPYDLSGNQKSITKGSTAELTYNCCENLVRYITVKRGDGQTDDGEFYVYDGAEQRVRKVQQLWQQGGAKRLVDKIYIGNYEEKKIVTISSSGGENIELLSHSIRVMDGDNCIAILNYWTKDDKAAETDRTGQWQFRYQFDNLIGSVSVELDETGGLLSYEEYFPYGGTSIIAGLKQVDVSEKVYRYSGKECDDFTGMYYYGRRYYIPWMGRWSSPDPAGTIDGLNRYAFVGGNPVTYYDEAGLKKRTHEDLEPEIYEGGEGWGSRIPKATKTTKQITNPTGHREDFGLELIAAPAKTKNKTSWGKYYRMIMEGMDELISTSFTREFVAGALSNTLSKQQQSNFVAMINDISSIRFPTKWSGFASTTAMTSDKRMQHPSVGIWRKKQVKGSLDPHYHYDLDRKEQVLLTLQAGLKAGHSAEQIKTDMIITAVTYTLNLFTAPALAKDQHPEVTNNKVLEEQTDAREFLKGIAISLGAKIETGSTDAKRAWGSEADRRKRYLKRTVSQSRIIV